MSRPPVSPNHGLSEGIRAALAQASAPANTNGNGDAPHRKVTTDEYVSGHRAIAVIDTPMRKLEVIESRMETRSGGFVFIRDTAYDREKAGLSFIYLSYHEAEALAAVLGNLQPADERQQSLPPTPEKSTNVDIRKAGRA
jgi:hypothetical protein